MMRKAEMRETDGTIRIVYSPESQMRTPGRLLRFMWKDLKNSRELAWRLFVRDLSAKYRQSLLGIFWAFLPPVLTGLVFIVLQSRKIISFSTTDIPYPVFALVGTTLWQLFTESLHEPLNVVRNAKPMLAKINFPRGALILSAFYQILFNLLIKMVIIAAVLWYFSVELSLAVMFSPLAIFMLIFFGIAIGLLLTPIGILYTDISSGLMIVTQLWFFVTPVIYPPPQSFPYSLIAVLNPVSPLIVGIRDLITKGGMANMAPFLAISGLTIVLLFIAWVIFHVALPIIIERMSA